MNKSSSKRGTKTWVHPPEALLRGHIVYNVKFLGFAEVDTPKGTEIVKEAIRKMKFNKQIKKAEGQKPPKVELTISVDGVTIQEPKYKVMQHRYPLHRMSYCADDKSDKRVFTFIAKDQDTSTHRCFVFDSEKCAEEITLTIGQAFDLAYKRFTEKSMKDVDVRKNYLLLQKKVQQLVAENLALKSRVADLERHMDPQLLEEVDRNAKNTKRQTSTQQPSVGTKLENLILDDESQSQPSKQTSQPQSTSHTNGTSALPMHPSGMPILTPPPPVPHRNNIPKSPPPTGQPQGEVDAFGQKPFTPTSPTPSANTANQNIFPMAPQQQNGSVDPFGMSSFTPSTPSGQMTSQMTSQSDLDRQIQQVDKELLDLQTGFSSGLSFAPDDFSLQDLDPLNHR